MIIPSIARHGHQNKGGISLSNELVTCHEKRINYITRRLKELKKTSGTIQLTIHHDITRAWQTNLFFKEEYDKYLWVQEQLYHWYFEPHFINSFKLQSYKIVEVQYGQNMLVAKCTVEVEELVRVLYERFSNFDDMILRE